MIAGWWMGPAAVSTLARELLDHAPMVRSPSVLSLTLVTFPAGVALPSLPPDMLPQTRLAGDQGNGRPGGRPYC